MEAALNISFTSESLAPCPPASANNSFPLLGIAMLCIAAAVFLLVSYYVFVTKGYFRWQQIDPLRRFSFRRARLDEDSMSFRSLSWQSRGLDELLIREIPTFQYKESESEEICNSNSSRFSECVVCLNVFQENDLLRVLPKCAHAFHSDCIDVWLQKNSNCPLCRSAITGRNRCRIEKMIAPNSSPQDSEPVGGGNIRWDQDFVVREHGTGSLSSRQQEIRDDLNRFLEQSLSHSSRKFQKSKPGTSEKFWSMGDEGIDVRQKDDQFSVQAIRRSFSMDSAVDRHVYVSVQEILVHNRNLRQATSSEESSSRSQRSIFYFGQGSRSRNAVLPVEF